MAVKLYGMGARRLRAQSAQAAQTYLDQWAKSGLTLAFAAIRWGL